MDRPLLSARRTEAEQTVTNPTDHPQRFAPRMVAEQMFIIQTDRPQQFDLPTEAEQTFTIPTDRPLQSALRTGAERPSIIPTDHPQQFDLRMGVVTDSLRRNALPGEGQKEGGTAFGACSSNERETPTTRSFASAARKSLAQLADGRTKPEKQAYRITWAGRPPVREGSHSRMTCGRY
jgi:hypothetical protein